MMLHTSGLWKSTLCASSVVSMLPPDTEKPKTGLIQNGGLSQNGYGLPSHVVFMHDDHNVMMMPQEALKEPTIFQHGAQDGPRVLVVVLS